MIYLFHGDNNAESRLKLRQTVKPDSQLQEIVGDKLSPKDLESILLSTNLFGDETLIIENLFSRTRSKERDLCISLLINYVGDKNILIWEKKPVTKASLNKVPKTWKVFESKYPALLFNFLDSLYPGNFKSAHSVLTTLRAKTAEPLILFMLVRQISSLIQAQSATSLKLPPWQIGKLKSQASKWSEQSLIKFMHGLYDLDLKIKSGKTKLDMPTRLDILLLQVLG